MKNHPVKAWIAGALSMLTLANCQNTPSLTNELLLAKNWEIQSSAQINETGETLSSSQATITDWYKGQVPSTVMGTLMKNGIYNDVLEGMNYEKIDKSLFDKSWWYRTEFELPQLQKGQHVALELDGLSYRANIWLNGQLIADKDSIYGTFRRHRLDITQATATQNTLAIEVFKAQPGEPNIGYVDWNPRPADESMGLFREVRVLTTGPVALNHIAVKSKINTETCQEAWLTVEAELNNLSNQPIDGQLTGTLEGQTFSYPVQLAAGEKRIIKLTSQDIDWLHINQPRLWWCQNLGTPEMYQMEVQFITDHSISDQKTVDFGIREIKDYFTKEGYRGFLLNGKPVLVRSAGWTDDIFLRDTPETNEIQVKYVHDMNLNSIRFENIWGTSQNIYDLCDRYGLLALVGWSCHWEWENYLGSPCDEFGGIKSEADMNLIATSFRDQVLWLRNHPSIIGWFVGSDMMPRPALEKKYLACLKEIDDRPYLSAAKEMTSSVSGPSGMKMAGPYEYIAPNYWYSPKAPGGAFGFNTETGIGAQLPVKESLQKMIPADKLWPIGKEWEYHCTTSTSAMNTLEILKEAVTARYGQPTDLDDFLRKADWLNYEGTRTMFEAFRVNIPQTTGIVQWMLNSAWPSLYWQLYDYYRIPTSAYYSVRHSNAPQQLIYNYAKNAIQGVNEGNSSKSLIAEMYLYNLNGKKVDYQQANVELTPHTVKDIFEIPSLSDENIVLFLILKQDNRVIARNYYVLSKQTDIHDWKRSFWVHTPIKKYANFKPLALMPQATCHVNAQIIPGKDAHTLQVHLENSEASLAFFTRLSLKNDCGELLTPIYWEDNYVSLMPGERRTICCHLPQGSLHSSKVILSVYGWNMTQQDIVLSTK